MYNFIPSKKPQSPKSPVSGLQRPKFTAASPSLFKSCNLRQKTVSVPHIKYVLTQQPIVVEKIHKEVKYRQVPVTREFVKHTKPTRVVKMPCSPKQCRSPRRCGMKKMHSPCGMRSPCGVRRSPCGVRSPPCGMRPRAMQKFSPCNTPCRTRFNPNVKRDGFPCNRSPNFSHTFPGPSKYLPNGLLRPDPSRPMPA